MNLMISEGRGEDHHSLLLTIKIRLASTVSTLASVKAWQGREGRQPPRSAPPFHPVLGCLRVCHVNYGDPTVPFTDCSVLKDIDNPFFMASTVTDSISSSVFWQLVIAVFTGMFHQTPKSAELGLKSARAVKQNNLWSFTVFSVFSFSFILISITTQKYT